MIKKIRKFHIPKKLFFLMLILVFLILTEISILKAPSSKIDLKSFEEKCSKQTQDTAKLQCWDDLFDESLKQDDGLDKAFSVLGKLYTEDPFFSSGCHGITHKIGEKAYKLFSKKLDFQLSPKSFYCGYGFYHGFMDTMLHTTGTLTQGREFCKYAGEKLANLNNDAEGTCYHGIGHGVVDGSDPRAWGNAEAIIQPGLELCKKVSPTETLLNRCSSGVFNSLAIMMNGNQYKLSVDKKNPMWVCKKQSNPIFKMTCYEEMNTILLPLEGGDFKKAVQWIKEIPEEQIAISAMDSLGQHAASFRKKDSDQSEYIRVCQQWPDKFRSACIGGFSAGILLYGTPGSEYIEGIKFCNSDLLSQEDHKACLERFMWSLYITYPLDKFKIACQSLVENDRQYCSKFSRN